jgi:hypothetical protein
LTWSELVGQAGGPVGAEGTATAGVLLLPGVVPWAVGLAAALEPDAPGWLLPDDAHPATAAAQVSAAIVTASRPALSFMARREQRHGLGHRRGHEDSDNQNTLHNASQARTSGSKPETTQACAGL